MDRLASAVLVLAVNEFTIEAVALGSAFATCTRILKRNEPFVASAVDGLQTIVPATGCVCAMPNVSVMYVRVVGNTSVITTWEAGSTPTLVIAIVYVMICPGSTVVSLGLLATARSVVPRIRSWRLSTPAVRVENTVAAWYPLAKALTEKFPAAIGLVVVSVKVYQPLAPVEVL